MYSYEDCFVSSGHMILGDSFNTSLFKQTWQKVFSKDSGGHFNMAFNASFEIKVNLLCSVGHVVLVSWFCAVVAINVP